MAQPGSSSLQDKYIYIKSSGGMVNGELNAAHIYHVAYDI